MTNVDSEYWEEKFKNGSAIPILSREEKKIEKLEKEIKKLEKKANALKEVQSNEINDNLTFKETCKALSIAPTTLRDWTNKGLLIKIQPVERGKIFYKRAEVEKMLVDMKINRRFH